MFQFGHTHLVLPRVKHHNREKHGHADKKKLYEQNGEPHAHIVLSTLPEYVELILILLDHLFVVPCIKIIIDEIRVDIAALGAVAGEAVEIVQIGPVLHALHEPVLVLQVGALVGKRVAVRVYKTAAALASVAAQFERIDRPVSALGIALALVRVGKHHVAVRTLIYVDLVDFEFDGDGAPQLERLVKHGQRVDEYPVIGALSGRVRALVIRSAP